MAKETILKKQTARPSEFMRARRPELFSDSKEDESYHLSREVFEYHLDTLTSRKQEIEFEHFCRRLAEKEICPNLLPQTGPTGGGDSKVDAETYPVADAIADRWFEGIGREASNERWAFAFSAKKDWKPKVEHDVDKIVKTGRGYKQIFFITNQFVRDKARADVETELEKQHLIPVRILDRMWIMRCVFENRRVELAVETLRLEGFRKQGKRVLGPLDAERETELGELEKHIGDSNRYIGLDYQLAEDCLQAAILSRGLNRPKHEVQSKFDRALRIAEKVGLTRQLLRIKYTKAWTAYWWFDDHSELNSLYDEVEKLVVGTDQAQDMELLSNLWQVLNASVTAGSIDSTAAQLKDRTSTLESELERLAADGTRPTNSLHAKALKVIIDVPRHLGIPERLSADLEQLQSIIVQGEKLSSFPLEPLIKIAAELGDILPDNPTFDAIMESVIKVAERRKGEGEAGRLLLEQGSHKLRAGKKYDAIRLLGRARGKLAKDEYTAELIATFAGLTLAYEATGLLWAARICVLAALNEILSSFIEEGRLERRALKYIMKMVWLELQLGRVPCALSWMDMAHVVASQTATDQQANEAYERERRSQDVTLGALFLRMDASELKWLDFLPAVLDKRSLQTSWLSLLYALGYEEYLRSQNAIPESETRDSVRGVLWQAVSGPGSEDLPDNSQLLLQRKVTFRTYVIGCEVIIELDNELPSIYLAETILGVLEALLSTSLQDLLPLRPTFNIELKSSADVTGKPKAEVANHNGSPQLLILHPKDLNYQTLDERKEFASWLMEVLLLVTFHIAPTESVKAYFDQTVRSDDLFGRAIDFSELRILTENILGCSPRYSITDWEKEKTSELFPLKRESIWSTGLEKPTGGRIYMPVDKIEGGPSSPADGFGVDSMKHKDRRVLSVIELSLWDKAEWGAVIYATDERLRTPPFMAIAFEQIQFGRKIFERWQMEIGNIDDLERLRVSIIRGIDKRNPAAYKVFIGPNLKSDKRISPGTQWVMVSRIHRMDPKDSTNLNRFLKNLEQSKVYLLVPASDPRSKEGIKILPTLGILKKELNVIDAWQLTQTDPELVAVEDEDDIIVPPGLNDVPVHVALNQVRRKTPKLPSP